MPCPHAGSRGARGFTLVEVVVVLIVLSILLTMAAVITRAVMATQRQSTTLTRLATIDAALVQFVMQRKRLPCPGNGALASTHAQAGLEGARDATGCTGTQQDGVVPWRALGLTEVDATDGWDRRLTYRVQPGLAAENALDMSSCDPAGQFEPAPPAACAAGCTSTNLLACTKPERYLFGRGVTVCNAAGCDPAACNAATIATAAANCTPATANAPLMHRNMIPHTGAAYVVISHGPTGGGAYLGSGALQATTATVDGTEEQKNYANVAFNANNYYVDNTVVDAADATHFDDIVSRPSLLSLVNKAGLGPRSH